MRAYLDTFSGLLPVEVLHTSRTATGSRTARVRVTARKPRGGYAPGEVLPDVHLTMLAHRQTRTRAGHILVLPITLDDLRAAQVPGSEA